MVSLATTGVHLYNIIRCFSSPDQHSRIQMDNNSYRINIIKWLPFPDTELNAWFKNTIALNNVTNEQTRNIALIIEKIQNSSLICDAEVIILFKII